MITKFFNLFKRDDAVYYYGMKVDNTPDPQQMAVYGWQNEISRYPERKYDLGFRGIVELCKNVCADYGIEMPVVHQGLIPMPAYDEEGGHTLYFPSGKVTIMTVIHELAHVICVDRYGTTVEGHGPEYVQCYIDLLAYLRNTGTDELFLSAIHRGLCVKGIKPEPLYSGYEVESVWIDEYDDLPELSGFFSNESNLLTEENLR